ncbi:MAG TPA: hypothetical protein VF050_08300 [Moraxellaceae bacterium]
MLLRSVFILSLLLPSLCLAQTPSERTEKFLKLVVTEPDKAIDEVFAGSGIAELKPQAIQAMKSQTKAAMAFYGVPLGVEKVLEEDISPSVKHLVYIQKFELYPVAWDIYFYKAKDNWVVNGIIFNDQIAPLVGSKK